MTDIKAKAAQHEATASSTPQQMMSLLEVQALSLNMNNAANAQQNAYILNTAIIGSICKRILTAGNAKEQAVKK